jgi:hypothetical protein
MFKTTVSRIALLAGLTALPAATAAAEEDDQDRFALGEVVIAGAPSTGRAWAIARA